MAPKKEKEELYGIYEIYRPPAPIEPEVDIVAVHGLNGGALRTWTTVDSGICWLNDAQFLPKYIPNARVLVWGYNASFSSLTGDRPSKDRIHHHAHTLVANLAADRRLSGTSDKPIIFLCHSMGGIIVKRALSYAQTRTGHKVSHDYNIFSCTHSILFFGTPHHGSSKATWLDYLKKLGAAATLGRASRRSDLVAALALESETLQNITDYFVPLMRHFRIFYFWEQARTSLGGPLLGRDYVVAHDSAAPAHDETERAAIAADHCGMVRFDRPTAQGFRMVVDALVRYCGEAAGEVAARRRVDAARALGLERSREVGEALRNGLLHSRGVAPLMLPPSEGGYAEFAAMLGGGTAGFRSIDAPDDEVDASVSARPLIASRGKTLE